MAELHRLNRRAFLTDMGKRTIAIAVVGPGVLAACSSDGSITAAPISTVGPSDSPTSSDAAPTTTADLTSDSVEPLDFRWERVEVGTVSAYLIARGSEVAIVDTGFAGNIPKFDDALAVIGAAWGDVNHVILTHKHPDHIGGLPEITVQAPNAAVYIGEADLGSLPDGVGQPINDGDEVFGLQILGTPGHTPGHVSVLDEAAGFLVAGDALIEGDGLVLGPSDRFSEDITQANASVQRLADRSFETVVFGHGSPVEGGASAAVIALAQTL